jgi:hypothetical protein
MDVSIGVAEGRGVDGMVGWIVGGIVGEVVDGVLVGDGSGVGAPRTPPYRAMAATATTTRITTPTCRARFTAGDRPFPLIALLGDTLDGRLRFRKEAHVADGETSPDSLRP